jgi:hypothetical protein
MKTSKLNFSGIIALVIFSFISINISIAQNRYYWVTVPCPNSQVLYAMYPLTTTANYIVGDFGTLLKLNSGSWVQMTGLPTANFYGIGGSLPDHQIRMTIVGAGGTIVSTEDAFANWIQETNANTNNLYAVTSASTSSPFAIRRIAVGAGGIILKSDFSLPNSWSAWTTVTSNTTQDLHSVFFSGLNGWICGNAGTLLHTTDMGATWNSVSPGTSENLNCINFSLSSPQTGLIAGNNGVLLKTTNNGLNWIPQTSGVPTHLRAVAGNFAAGSNGTIIQSPNNGINWEVNGQPYTATFNSITSSGDIAGAGGLILKAVLDTSYKNRLLNANNISSYFVRSGIFDQSNILGNLPGFEWPKGSNKHLIFTAGLSVAAKINGQLREAMASYNGEYKPGAINNGIPFTNGNFKIYSVRKTDSWQSNSDWMNWGNMVPYGAPFVDVNSNGTYEYNIDTPGVKNAAQTLFICLTDGFDSTHNAGEGFGGGTPPLKSEMHLTAWAFTNPSYADMQFVKFEIINKNASPWNNTYFSLFSDPDIGNAIDDYIGCDTIRNLGFAYNGDNNDPVYGGAPPAAGFVLLQGARNKYSFPPINLGMTSFGTMYCMGGCPAPPCEYDPNGEPYGAYLMMKGYKKDSTRWMDVSQIPPRKTFYIYSGDPESNNGWTEPKGHMNNCGGDTTGSITVPNIPGDRRLIISSGAENLTVEPGDTQTIVIAQLAARGNSNLNSVTKLKQLSDVASNYFNNNSLGYTISGNVRYADNNQPVIYGGYVKALKLDKFTGNVQTVDSTGILPDGSYILPAVPHDSVYIGAYPNSSGSTPDFVPGYYPASINWQQAIVLFPAGNLNNINISVYRVNNSTTTNSVNGRIFKLSNGGLKDACLYAKSGTNFVRFAFSDDSGIFHLLSLPAGSLKIIVHRLGFSSDSTTVNLASSLDSVNFYLNQLYVGITENGNIIPEKYSLYQNYPNPFNPVTKIKFEIPLFNPPLDKGGRGGVSLKIFNILGKEVATLVNENLQPGSYEVSFNGVNLSSGIYFYKLTSGDPGGSGQVFSDIKRAVLIK